MANLTAQRNTYQANFHTFKTEVNRIMSTFNYHLVLEDETEIFRESSDISFDYPFEKRKTVLEAEDI